MSGSTGPPEKEVIRPLGLVRWMVKASVPDRVKAEAIAAFEDEFLQKVADRGKLKAHLWALRIGWKVLYRAHDSLFQLVMILVAIVALLIAL